MGFGVLELLILHLSGDFLSHVQTLPRPPRPSRRPAGERLRASRKQPRPAGSGARRNQAETLLGAKGSVPSSAAAPKPAGCSAEGPAGTGGGEKSLSCGQGWRRGGCWSPVPGAAGGSPVTCRCWSRSPSTSIPCLLPDPTVGAGRSPCSVPFWAPPCPAPIPVLFGAPLVPGANARGWFFLPLWPELKLAAPLVLVPPPSARRCAGAGPGAGVCAGAQCWCQHPVPLPILRAWCQCRVPVPVLGAQCLYPVPVPVPSTAASPQCLVPVLVIPMPRCGCPVPVPTLSAHCLNLVPVLMPSASAQCWYQYLVPSARAGAQYQYWWY